MNQKNSLKIGDVIKAEFELFIEDEKQPKYCKTTKIEIGKDQYFPGLDKLLLEEELKHEMTFDFQVSSEFSKYNWANKSAKVKIKVLTLIKKNKKVIFVYPEKNKYEEQIRFLQSSLYSKDIEVKATIMDIKEKAKTLQKKATEEIQKSKSENDAVLQKEKEEIKMYAMQSFLEDFIIPYNNFLLALRAGEKSTNIEVKNYVIGFKMIDKQFVDLLSNHKVEIIAPEYLEHFDAEKHYAIDFIETNDHEENTIAQLSSSGLMLNNRVVKPAMVALHKKISN